VLCRPVTAPQALAANIAVPAVVAAGIGVAAAVPFIVLAEPFAGALLWGAGLAEFGTLTAVLGALTTRQ
jgi:hypothetical protein